MMITVGNEKEKEKEKLGGGGTGTFTVILPRFLEWRRRKKGEIIRGGRELAQL